MPLSTWYRFIRTLPGVLVGLPVLAIGIYLIVAPVSYRDPNNPKMVAYANSIHPAVIALGVFAVLGALALICFGVSRYFLMPGYLREYSYEQLRLGQALAREIARLTPDSGEFHSRSFEYEDGSEIRLHAWDRKGQSWRNLLLYGFGRSVSCAQTQPPTEVDGVLHVPEIRLYINSFSGKASRHESVEQYVIWEDPPLLEGEKAEFLKYAIRETRDNEEPEEELEEALESLTTPRFTTIRLDREVEDPAAYYGFMRQMGLDKPSAEELRIALDKLKEW